MDCRNLSHELEIYPECYKKKVVRNTIRKTDLKNMTKFFLLENENLRVRFLLMCILYLTF